MPVFLFTDIEDSTKKWEKYSAAMPKALKIHDDILANAVNAGGGRIIKHTGDGIFAVFNSKNAVNAAVDIQKKIGSEKWDNVGELRVRIGIHAGEAEARGEDYFGPEINKTARVLSLGWGGQILATPEAIDGSALPEGTSLQDLGLFSLKGVEAPQRVMGVINEKVKWQKFPPLKSSTQQFFNMPSYNTVFTGREKECAYINSFFGSAGARCLTLVAQGGMGKSRLAAEAVKTLAEIYLDGIAYVELAPINEPERIPFEIANVLSYTFYEDEAPVKQLVNYLKDRKMLLILDNFEHLLEGADIISSIINGCPRTSVLVTSRARLGIEKESALELHGLEMGENGEAVKLFWEHALKYAGGREFDEDEKKAAVKFCEKVNGLPLAMELAAPWLKVMSVNEIVDEMESGADILKDSKAGARHSSMRSLFEYSYSLLSESEKNLMKKLTFFKGGFSRQAAVKITLCSLSELMSLADKSFIKIAGASKFIIHELVKQYAREKLEEDSAGLSELKQKHSGYYLSFLQSIKGSLTGPKQKELMENFGHELENINFAWNSAVDTRNYELLYDISEVMFNYYELRNRFIEGIDIFISAVMKTAGEPEAEALGGLLRTYAGALYRHIGAFDNSEKQLLKGIEILKIHGKMKEAAHGLNHLGLLYEGVNKYQQALSACRESLEIYENMKDTDSAAFSAMVLGSVLYNIKDYEQSTGYINQALSIFDKAQNLAGLAWANYTLAQVEKEQKKFTDAAAHFENGIRIYKHVSDKKGISWGYNMFCELEMERKNYDEARRLCMSGLKLRMEIGDLLGEIYSYTNLGIIGLEAGNLQEAYDNCVTAFRLSIKSNVPYKATENLIRAAEIKFRNNKVRDAARCAYSVFRFSNMPGETEEKARELLQRCEAILGNKDIENIKKAYQFISTDEILSLLE